MPGIAASQYIDIDVSVSVLTSAGRKIEFALLDEHCQQDKISDNPRFEFALVRASHCNGALLPLPHVAFEQTSGGEKATLTIVDPVPRWYPSLVECARASIRIEYWPRDANRRQCI